MANSAKSGVVAPLHYNQLFLILQSRIQEQDEKYGRLLEICYIQNTALKDCKSTSSALASLVEEVKLNLDELLSDSLKPIQKADDKKEAA